MLTVQALQSGEVLARKFDARNLIIRPLAGSVLDQLVKASCTDSEFVFDNRVDLDLIAGHTNRADPVTGFSGQDEAMKDVTRAVSDAVSNHLLVARTIVAPAVDEMVQRVQQGLEQALRLALTHMEVKIFYVPAPLREPTLIDSFTKAKDIPFEDFNVGAHLPPADAETIRGYCKSGATGLDQAIEEFLNGLGEEQLVSIYETFFTTKANGVIASSQFEDPVNGLNNALVAYLVARKLWDAPPDGVEMTLQSYEAEMVRIRDQAAVALIRGQNKLLRYEENGILVISYTQKSVEVYEPVYRKWIADGGTNEVLFGNVLSNNPRMNVAAIAENVEEYKKRWELFCTVQRTTEANKRFSVAKDLVRSEFHASLAELTHDEAPLQDRQIIAERFTKALQVTTEDEVKDPYRWILRLLCASRFYETDAFKILDGISRIKRDNPDVDVREAAAAATIQYISDWVAAQLVVSNATK